ncbi:Hemolymph protein 14, partial [Operophtera brumata]
MVFVLLAIFAVSVGADLVNFKVEYRCIVTGAIEGTRECGASEPAGTIVSPQCRRPNYYTTTPLTFMQCFDGYWDYIARCSPGILHHRVGGLTTTPRRPSCSASTGTGTASRGAHQVYCTIVSPQCRRPNYYTTTPFMQCFDGYWEYIARCSPECGRITPDGKKLVVGGTSVKRGELPWHAGIYDKATNPYMQICGGSLISNNVVLSGKFNISISTTSCYQVKVIHLPTRYQGSSTNFQDDIAVVIVASQFTFETFIRPVPARLHRVHHQRQDLRRHSGITLYNGKPSPVLQVVSLPFVEVGTCINRSPPDFIEYITSDKICDGTQESNTALCRGDSGGGLAFSDSFRGVARYYLRGVVSTAPKSDNACNTDTYTSFTSIMKHEHFIKQFWSESVRTAPAWTAEPPATGYVTSIIIKLLRRHQGVPGRVGRVCVGVRREDVLQLPVPVCVRRLRGPWSHLQRGMSPASSLNYCDGTKECPDGSDESVWACAAKTCSNYLFQCAYGACVDRGATCNGIVLVVDLVRPLLAPYRSWWANDV